MNVLFGRIGQKAAAMAAAAFTCYAIGVEYSSTYPWAMMAIIVLIDFLSYRSGVVEGIVMYRNLNPEQRNEFNKMLDEAEDG